MPRTNPHLTKSKYISGLRCPRMLWFNVHDPAPFSDPEPGSALDVGIRIGRMAHQLFPGGVEVEEAPWEHEQARRVTQSLMENQNIPAIFEAAFEYENVRIRVDVLERLNSGTWGLREVKSGLSVKESSGHIDDASVQLHVLRGCGLSVPSVELIHVNRDYILGDEGVDWSGFFVRADIADACETKVREISGELARQWETVGESTPPDVYPTKSRCLKPWECNFWDRCTSAKPDDWIIHLPSITQKKVEELVALGIEAIHDIPDDFPLSEKHEMVRHVIQSGKPYVSSGLGPMLHDFGPPAFYLDFETISPVIPIYAGMSPYQTIPFQWSIHYVDDHGGMTHFEHLADGADDPRRELAERLLEALPEADTPILAYNATFEKGVILDLARSIEGLSDQLEALVPRLRDPLPIIRSHTYFREYKGSFSLKAVGPALVPEVDYVGLEGISDGLTASIAFERLIAGELIEGETPEDIRRQLFQYCELDTLAMVGLHKSLLKLAGL